jgi:hypothetical protein
MGGRWVGPWLEKWAAWSSNSIVEVGSWLGASTAYLALGARRAQVSIYTYDRWTATGEEVEKAARSGIYLVEGENTLPRVKEWLKPFGAEIFFQQGDIRDVAWDGGPISLYIDDAAKTPESFRHVVDTFGPHWVEGCVVVLMDYYFFEKSGKSKHRCQKEFIESHYDNFVLIEDRIAGTTAAAFEFKRRTKMSFPGKWKEESD